MTMSIHNAENQSWMRARWQSLMTHLASDHAGAEATWDAVVQHYTEPHRAYHNFFHIMALLRHADAERASIRHPEVVELAIWFHDVIYDTHATDNELRSAAWARQAMETMRIEPGLIPPVEQCILATQRHEVISPQVSDLPLFLDLDLAILGAPETAYRRYCRAIRAEYDWVPERAYRAARQKILKALIERPALFHTPAMAARYEEQARHNIEWELRELTSL